MVLVELVVQVVVELVELVEIIMEEQETHLLLVRRKEIMVETIIQVLDMVQAVVVVPVPLEAMLQDLVMELEELV